MILVDTCGWIEWLTNGALSEQYEPYFNQVDSLIVSTSIQSELYKWVARKKGVQRALEAIVLIEQAEDPLDHIHCAVRRRFFSRT